MNERQYQSTDLPRVIEIYTASIRSLATPYYSPEQIAAWAPIPPDAARWRERLGPLHTIVAEFDGLVAGFVSYTDDGYLDFLFTHPACARRSVATSLYQRVEAELLAVSARRVTTHASLSARPFFDRHRFQVDGEECVECQGVYLRRFAMHKELSNDATPNDAPERTRPSRGLQSKRPAGRVAELGVVRPRNTNS